MVVHAGLQVMQITVVQNVHHTTMLIVKVLACPSSSCRSSSAKSGWALRTPTVYTMFFAIAEEDWKPLMNIKDRSRDLMGACGQQSRTLFRACKACHTMCGIRQRNGGA